jgi:ZIP family zinc transporter
MEPATAQRTRRPAWLAGVAPLAVLAVAIGLFVLLDAPGLNRIGVPQEELAVERTVLKPGEIQLHVRNDGPDPVRVRQVIVNDAFATFKPTDREIGRLGGSEIDVEYPWIEGENYDVRLLTSTGVTIDHTIDAAVETPNAGLDFYGLMALIGIYVGVIPVAIGMLWLPWLRGVDTRWIRFLLAFTVGLLGFLGVEALLDGTQLAGTGAQAFGGAALVWLGAAGAFLALAGVDAWLRGRRRAGAEADADGDGAGAGTGSARGRARRGGAGAADGDGDGDGAGDGAGADARLASAGYRAAFLVALGIGLHNLGEGLAIGSAYAVGSLALGATLVIGFALHNTTEGLAIVSPVAQERQARLRRLALLGLLAGAPAVLGAWIGASAFNPSLAAFMFGIGAGAIAQVVVQIAPAIRDRAGRLLHPLAVAGLLTGLAVMYVTGLMVSL